MTQVRKPEWTCPNCKVVKFDSQNKMVQHAIQCKVTVNESISDR